MHTKIIVGKEAKEFEYILTIFETNLRASAFQVIITPRTIGAPSINKKSIILIADSIDCANSTVSDELKRLFEQYGYSFQSSSLNLNMEELNSLLDICNEIAYEIE